MYLLVLQSEVEMRRKRATVSLQPPVGDKEKKIWANFPRNCWFYDSSIFTLGQMAKQSTETAITMISY